MIKNKRSKVFVIVLSIVLVACSSSGVQAECRDLEEVDVLNVVATTPMIGEFVNQVGGNNINLTVLMPPEADPHTYEPAPQDAETIANADLIFYTGLKYEPAPLIKLLENSSCGVEALAEVGDAVYPIEFKESGHDEHGDDGHDDEEEDAHAGHDHGEYDPHFWFDPNRVSYAASFIEGKLVSFDPENKESYEASYNEFASELKGLVNQVIEIIGTIPSQNRKIITTHESLGYLEAKFGLEVLSTIIPSLNSANEISPQDLGEVIEVIEDNKVKVIFIESEAPSVYAETIVSETGIKAVKGLWVETLKQDQTYADFLIEAVTLIAENTQELD
tara:strand:- start:6806 stop:7801 length:996 start_codon:yes stop_codon:yes gene_type:complete